MSCVFCTGVARAGEVVFEDERTWIVLHPDWSPRGHAMIVAKRHVENASDLDEEEWLHVARVWHRAERALLALTGADRAIVMKLGIQTPHLHLHLYPMQEGDDRAKVFAAIEGHASAERDEQFVNDFRNAVA